MCVCGSVWMGVFVRLSQYVVEQCLWVKLVGVFVWPAGVGVC